eukprot:scaffold6130_cov112-Isochrysis_galbana.AAC.2
MMKCACRQYRLDRQLWSGVQCLGGWGVSGRSGGGIRTFGRSAIGRYSARATGIAAQEGVWPGAASCWARACR